MTIKHRTITEYKQDERNANAGSERGQAMLEESLSRLGAGRSILVDADDNIIAGNKTQQAAVDAGIENVIEVETDGKTIVVVKRTDLHLPTDQTAKRLAIADNRTAQVSLTWEPQVLEELNEEGVLDGFFTENEIQMIVGDEPTVEEGGSEEEFPAYDEEIETEYCCPKCGYSWSGKPK